MSSMTTSRCTGPLLQPTLLPGRLSTSRAERQCIRLLPCNQPSRRFKHYSPSTVKVSAQKPDIYKVAGRTIKVAKDLLDSGTKLVPESVPRPLAQIGVAGVGMLAVSYLLQSLFSTLLFVLAIGGVSYYIFIVLNKDNDNGKGGGSSTGRDPDLTLEEAKRIMEKYK